MLLVCGEVSRLRVIVDLATVLYTATIVASLATTTEPQDGVTGFRGNATSNSSRGIDNELPDEQRLLMKLLRSYDPGIRPVFNVSRNVVVNFSLTLVQIMDMVRTVLRCRSDAE